MNEVYNWCSYCLEYDWKFSQTSNNKLQPCPYDEDIKGEINLCDCCDKHRQCCLDDI